MALDPTIPLGVKPIDFLGSAGNLLNLARGAQALEQEQAMNPIQQEKARIELGIARDTQAAEIARQKALSGSAVTAEKAAGKAYAGSVEETLRQNFAPLLQSSAYQDVTRDPKAAITLARKAKDAAIRAGVPADDAEIFTASLYNEIGNAQQSKNPALVNEWLFRNIMGSQTPSRQQELMMPAGTPQAAFGGVPGSVVATPAGAQFVPTLIEPRQQMPAQQMPQQGVQTSGVPLSTGIQQRPMDLSQVETGPANKLGAGVPQGQPQMAQPQRGVTAEAMSMPGLRYPVRTGGPFAPLQGEEADRETGLKYVNGLVSLQPQMQTTRRNIQEVVSKASEIEKNAYRSTGVLGAAERKIREFVGDSNYQQLSKDLANLQISLIQSKGGSLDTVAGQSLAAHANGDKTYAPDVLKSIARRTYGDVLATEAEGAAADLFRQRYGDANHAAFKQLWSKNSDSRVFELMGLEDLVQDPKEQEKVAREVILKGLSPKQIDELTKKYRNIKRLRETGSL
jgi:hypothetical protein